ncbi:MAG: hypothetical protein WC712_13415 [Candidatus Brocadiia bacterium]
MSLDVSATADNTTQTSAIADPSRSSVILSAVVLLAGFLGLAVWFGVIDVYHQHFFDAGPIVLAYNLSRVIFIGFFAWIIAASGFMLIAILAPVDGWCELPLAERLVLGFGAGTGLWQIAMLILGMLGLYYRSIMIVICCIVLCASARWFARIFGELTQCVACRITVWRQLRVGVVDIACLMIGGAIILLLLARGLYPGGGGDYYTHYFPYTQEVLRNHSLAPNDVWYHYYYSKGVGLSFLAMLLTDPQAPELVTFCCVCAAALALAALTARIAPNSLWPLVCGVLYPLFYLVSMPIGMFAGAGAGGDFQKSHEVTSALIVIVAWACVMYDLQPRQRKYPSFITAVFASIATAILTPVAGGLLAIIFALRAAWSLMRKTFHQCWGYSILCAAGTTLCIFVLNYWITGLVTDQALDFTWRFANLERLNRWGVIPQLIAVAWIRDNYARIAPPLGWEIIGLLRYFLRWDAVWPLLCSGVIALFGTTLLRRRNADRSVSPARTALCTLGWFVGPLVLLSAGAGRSQSVSYFRFSTFFFPLLALFAITCWAALMAQCRDPRCALALLVAAPIVLLTVSLISWDTTYNWFARVNAIKRHTLRFARGQYSLADAYSNQQGRGDYDFGAIYPGALAAMRQVGPNTRIWSMDVDSYCMVPGCRVESVISFMMSRHLNEILNGHPDQARAILQQEGLNYFLFSKEFRLLDLLPYSRLFAPDTIAEYLGIRWTDGKTYLLTWRGPGTTAIGADFLDAYTDRVTQPEHPWFRFRKLLPYMNTVMTGLAASPHPWEPMDFPWRRVRGIDVLEATYGQNCQKFSPAPPAVNSVYIGNATALVSDDCSGAMKCDFHVDVKHIEDPAVGCSKNFSVTYRCLPGGQTTIALVPPEANGKTVTLSCGLETEVRTGTPARPER